MYWITTKCYLCGKEAEKLFSHQNLRIRCEHCKTYYSFSSLVTIARLDEDTDALLYKDYETGEKHQIPNSNKLTDYVKKRTDTTGRLPFLITP